MKRSRRRPPILTRPLSVTAVAALLTVLSLASGCAFGRREDVAMRRFPYPYRAGLAVSRPEFAAARDGGSEPVGGSASGFSLFGDRVAVVPGPLLRTIGQDAPCSLIDRGKQFAECARSYFRTGRWPSHVYFGNRLLDTGSGHHVANMYAPVLRGVPGVGASSLEDALSDRVLLELEAKGGYMLLSPEGLSNGAHVDAARQRVAAAGRSSGILVAEPDDLVRRRVIETSLVWSHHAARDSIVVTVESIEDPFGGSFVPSVGDLAGLTFYTPIPGSTSVFVGEARVDSLVENPPDHTHRRSVTIVPEEPIRPGTSP